MQKIKTIHGCDEGKFDKEVSEYLSQGYIISSTGTCAAIQSEMYDFCPSFTAILVKEGKDFE